MSLLHEVELVVDEKTYVRVWRWNKVRLLAVLLLTLHPC